MHGFECGADLTVGQRGQNSRGGLMRLRVGAHGVNKDNLRQAVDHNFASRLPSNFVVLLDGAADRRTNLDWIDLTIQKAKLGTTCVAGSGRCSPSPPVRFGFYALLVGFTPIKHRAEDRLERAAEIGQ